MNITNIRSEKRQALEKIYQDTIKNIWFDITPYLKNFDTYRYFLFDILAQNKLVVVNLEELEKQNNESSQTNKDTEAL